MNSERDQNMLMHQTSLWMPQIPRLFRANDLRGVAVSWWPLSLAVTSVWDLMGPGMQNACCIPRCCSATAAGRSDTGGTSGHLQSAPRMVTAESVYGLFWSSDFVSGHKGEIAKWKNCMPPGASSGCDLSYLQGTKCSINFIIWILTVLSARSIISW